MTNDLLKRVAAHREGLIEGFTKRFGVKTLVYYETHTEIAASIARENRIKRWRREWKLQLIEAGNPMWRDLWVDLTEGR
ncbi:MAG: GIY-YIG nuclease family protein [Hyphomicrobium sp.]